MKELPPPPAFEKAFFKAIQDTKKAPQIYTIKATDEEGRYQHWEEIRHKIPPVPLTPEDVWAATKFSRSQQTKWTELSGKGGKPIRFLMPDSVLEALSWIDRNAAGSIAAEEEIGNPETRSTYLIKSLVEEAISSSQLEGASTTRSVAKEMLLEGRKPIGKSEQMILNNYRAMEFIQRHKSEDLTESMLLELHRLVTEETLSEASRAGSYRIEADNIQVTDNRTHDVLHIPPPAKELPQRMKRLIDFANGARSKNFVHPIIRGILLHFMLAYDHPFVDGNGRTARALFYWAMARQGYWVLEFVAISEIIKKAPGKYKQAFLYTESDENDATYFIVHQLEVIRKAVDELFRYLRKRQSEIAGVEQILQKSARLRGQLNHRQVALVRHAMKRPNAIYTIRGQQNTHGIVYQTARKDLLDLSDKLGLLIRSKQGKEYIFIAPPDLRQRIEKRRTR